MRKFSKVILFVLIGVLGIILAALIGVNLWLQSTGVQSRLQEKVESVLGVTIHVKSTFYTPWGGVRLSGLVIPDPSSKQPANFLEAQSFALRFDLIPLIKRHFVISQVALDNPILIWRQSEDGKWRLPTFAQKPLSLPPTTPGIPPLAPAPAPVPSIQIPAPQAPATVEQPANQEISKKSSSDFLKFLVEIHQVRINQGQGTFIDSKGEILATFTDLKIHAEVRSNNNISGQIHIADLAFRNRLHVRHFRAHFTKKINLLSSSDVTAHLAEGRMTGQVSVEMNSAPTFQTSIELKNVQLRSLMTEAGIDPGTSSGIILGNVALDGTLQSENDITGKGRLEMIQGKIEPPTFIQQLGVLLRIKELQMLVFQQSFVNFSINDQKFHVDDMKLESERIFFSAKGYIRFNKKVNLDARFGVSEEIQKELHGLADNFQSSTDRPGYKELIFAVSGKTDKLNSNLPEKIGIPKGLLQIGNNLGGFLKGFIAPSAPPQATPSATPQASPN